MNNLFQKIQTPKKPMRQLNAAVAFAFLLVMAARADDSLPGKWQGETRNQAKVTLVLIVNEVTVTGTFGRNDQTAEIKEGKVAANTFTFQASLNDRTERFTGEFTKEELRLWMDRQGRDSAIVLKRVKTGNEPSAGAPVPAKP